MLLYLMRHGEATTRPSSGELELTDHGRSVVRCTLESLASLTLPRPGRIYASPLKRAQQTASIARDVLGIEPQLEISEALLSETDPLTTLSFISSISGTTPTMLVGHDPLFSTIASMLVAGTEIPVLEMKKSAICAIEITRFEVPRMRGVLRLFLPPVASGAS
jgi:phosphohistidine phosphatase